MAQPCDEFKPGGSATDDYDAVRILVSLRCHALLICARCIMNSWAVHCFRHLLHSECTRAYEQVFGARVASMANSAVVGNDRESDCQGDVLAVDCVRKASVSANTRPAARRFAPHRWGAAFLSGFGLTSALGIYEVSSAEANEYRCSMRKQLAADTNSFQKFE